MLISLINPKTYLITREIAYLWEKGSEACMQSQFKTHDINQPIAIKSCPLYSLCTVVCILSMHTGVLGQYGLKAISFGRRRKKFLVIVSIVYFCYRWPSEGEKNANCPLQEFFLYEKTTRLAIVWPDTKM